MIIKTNKQINKRNETNEINETTILYNENIILTRIINNIIVEIKQKINGGKKRKTPSRESEMHCATV